MMRPMDRKPPAAGDVASREVVVTTHGWLAGRRSMAAVNRAIREAGFDSINWGYQSWRGSIVHHAIDLAALLNELFADPAVSRVHLITHSMGGIVARAALMRSRLEWRMAAKCGRLVMMAPPNGGSRLTRFPLGPFATWFPHLTELSERPDSLVNQLPPPRRMQVGVIAAARDFVVSVDATRLSGQMDHATVQTSHQRLAAHPEAIQMAVRFLGEGRLQPVATLPFPSLSPVLRSAAA